MFTCVKFASDERRGCQSCLPERSGRSEQGSSFIHGRKWLHLLASPFHWLFALPSVESFGFAENNGENTTPTLQCGAVRQSTRKRETGFIGGEIMRQYNIYAALSEEDAYRQSHTQSTVSERV